MVEADTVSTLVNQELDWSELSGRFARSHRLLIRDFLSQDALSQLGSLARSELPWHLQYRLSGQATSITEAELQQLRPEARTELFARVTAEAREDFQFLYYSCSLNPSHLRSLPQGHPIHAVARGLFNLGFIRRLSKIVNDDSIIGLTASVTRYDPGCFLLPHDDSGTQDARRVAFVLNLSEDWWPDWGGLLQFLDGDRNIETCFTPHAGSIALFKVPQWHCVSYVAPFAARSRFAITGWLIARP